MAELEKTPLVILEKYISDELKKQIIISTTTPLTFYDFLNYLNRYKKEKILLSDIQNINKQPIYGAIKTQLTNYNNTSKIQLGGGNALVELLNLIVFKSGPPIKDLAKFKNVPSYVLTNEHIPKLFEDNRAKILKLGFEIDQSQLWRKRTKQNDYGYLLTIIRKYCIANSLKLVSTTKVVNGLVTRVYSIEAKIN